LGFESLSGSFTKESLMLRMILAVTLAIYFCVPALVGALFADFPDDGFGWRGCFQCGFVQPIPGWVYLTGITSLIGGLFYTGWRQTKK
jgi:hypothetical protein